MPKSFDAANPPFDRLNEREIEELREAIDIGYYRPGEDLCGLNYLKVFHAKVHIILLLLSFTFVGLKDTNIIYRLCYNLVNNTCLGLVGCPAVLSRRDVPENL